MLGTPGRFLLAIVVLALLSGYGLGQVPGQPAQPGQVPGQQPQTGQPSVVPSIPGLDEGSLSPLPYVFAFASTLLVLVIVCKPTRRA